MLINDDPICLDFIGQIHNLPDMRNQFGLSGGDTSSLLLAAWFRWGKSLVEKLIGHYALVILNNRYRISYLARDSQ